jgi:PAS domain S-box-containing protein
MDVPAGMNARLMEQGPAGRLHRLGEEYFRLMVEGVRDYAIFMLDPGGFIITWNAGAERLKGYSPDESIGRHFSVFYPPEDIARGKPQKELKTALAEGRLEDEGWRVRKDGSVFWANVIITAIRDDTGRLVGFAKITRDLTERKRAETALARAKSQAETASAAKSEFLSNVSHELRTPLNTMMILARLLADNADGGLSEKYARYAEVIYSSGVDLLSLINEILDLSRIEAGAVPDIAVAPISVRALLGYVERTFRQVAQEKKLEFTFTVDAAVPAEIQTDQKRLQQILRNLLANGVKFTKEGSVSLHIEPVRFGWTPGHERLDRALEVVAFRVKDTGIGVPDDKKEIIFEPFQQGDGSTSRRYGGTGLGLSISSKFAQLLGGEIRVESTPGKGSTFTLYLPVA